jgi:hypothetical protein
MITQANIVLSATFIWFNRRCEMKTDLDLPSKQRFLGRPGTRLGWWAVGLGAAFVVLWIINSTVFMPTTELIPWRQVVLPFYGVFTMLCGFAAGIVGLIALIWRHERSWLVWLTLLPGLFVLVFVLGEFLVPH